MKRVLGIGLLVCITGTALWYATFHVVLRGEEHTPPPHAQGVQVAQVAQVTLGATVIEAQVARTKAARMRGLGGRASLRQGEGMLFIFDRVDTHGIWMRDMQFALDVLWINEDFKVVDIRRGFTPDTFPEVATPAHPARYVLEVPASTVARTGIVRGAQVDISCCR